MGDKNKIALLLYLTNDAYLSNGYRQLLTVGGLTWEHTCMTRGNDLCPFEQ